MRSRSFLFTSACCLLAVLAGCAVVPAGDAYYPAPAPTVWGYYGAPATSHLWIGGSWPGPVYADPGWGAGHYRAWGGYGHRHWAPGASRGWRPGGNAWRGHGHAAGSWGPGPRFRGGR